MDEVRRTPWTRSRRKVSTQTATVAQQSNAEGNGISEVIVGLEAQFDLTTRNAEEEQYYDARDCVTVKMRNRQGRDCATIARVQDNKDGSYKVSYFAKETGTCYLSVKVNDKFIHDSPFEVEVKPRKFKPVLSFGQQGSADAMFVCPWGVAVNERDEIAVTDFHNDRIQVFSSDGTHLRSFGNSGVKWGEFCCPAGIAFDPQNGNILVADRGNHRVQVFNEMGEYQQGNIFERQRNHDHEPGFPDGLSIDSDRNVIVTDSANGVKMFSSNGQSVRKIGEGSLTNPWHCVQYDNYLIVSDSAENNIKVFNKDGHFLYKFGKTGSGDGELNQPRLLSVNKAGHLMVCDEGNHRVQVFELSGKFVTKFGTEGTGKGEFNLPVSTAVLSDGRIVVTEFWNHRIQIFE